MPKAQPSPVEFGRFKRPSDDVEVIATTVDDANRYRFDGWQEIAPAEARNDWSAKAQAEQEQADAEAEAARASDPQSDQ